MNPKEAKTMSLHGTVGGIICGWAAGRTEWMYSFANPNLLGIAELGIFLVGSLLMIRVSLWLIKMSPPRNISN